MRVLLEDSRGSNQPPATIEARIYRVKKRSGNYGVATCPETKEDLLFHAETQRSLVRGQHYPMIKWDEADGACSDEFPGVGTDIVVPIRSIQSGVFAVSWNTLKAYRKMSPEFTPIRRSGPLVPLSPCTGSRRAGICGSTSHGSAG